MTAKTRLAEIVPELPNATRLGILEASDRVTEWVPVPEWGFRLCVRSLEGFERDRYEGSLVRWGKSRQGNLEVEGSNPENMRAKLVAMTVVEDEEPGAKNLFTDADVLILGHKSAAALDRIFSVAQRLSHLTDKDVEALTEQLGEDQSGVSGSASPVTSA